MDGFRFLFFAALVLGALLLWRQSEPQAPPLPAHATTDAPPAVNADLQPGASSGKTALPGVPAVATADPQQENADNLPAFDFRGYHLRPLARYRIAARVLGREEYSADRESELAPVDFALGWGPMADPQVLASIEISQSNRFFFWKTPAYPIPREEIERHAANVHLIPADTDVKAALDRIQADDTVMLGGYLVEASADDGWHWSSSLSRDDTGKGACELMYVTAVEVP